MFKLSWAWFLSRLFSLLPVPILGLNHQISLIKTDVFRATHILYIEHRRVFYSIKLREKMHHVACKNIFHSIQYEKGMGKFVLNLWRKVTMRKISWEGINHNYCLCSYRYLEPSSKKTTKNDDHNKNVVIFNFYVIAFKLGGEIFLALVSVWSSTP